MGPARSGKTTLLRALSRLTGARILTALEVRSGPGALADFIPGGDGAAAETRDTQCGLLLIDDLDAAGDGPREFERALRDLSRWVARDALRDEKAAPPRRFVAALRPRDTGDLPGGVLRFYLRPDRRKMAEGSLAALRTVADTPPPSLRQLSPAEAVLLLSAYICCFTDAANDDAKLALRLRRSSRTRRLRRLGNGAQRPAWAQYCQVGRVYRWFRVLGHIYRTQSSRPGGGEAASFIWEDNPEALMEELMRAHYLVREPAPRQAYHCLINATEARLLGDLVGIDPNQYID